MTIDDNPRERTALEVQEEFFSHLTDTVPYWIRSSYQGSHGQPHKLLKDSIEGFLHSFGSIVAGNAGGFDASVDMIVSASPEIKSFGGRNFFPARAKNFENAVDINDGGLQYRAFLDKNIIPLPDDSGPARQWNEGEILDLLYREIKSIRTFTVDKHIAGHFSNDYEALAFFARTLLGLFEEGSNKFPATVELYAVSNLEDQEYFREEGLNWVPLRTPLALPERSLTQAWDAWWEKTRPETVSSTLND